jgi:predicted metal-dependent hydrolase
MQTDDLSWIWEKSRRRKHVAMQINEEGVLTVRSSLRTSKHYVDMILRDKKDWIVNSINSQQKRIHPSFPKFASSGKLFFLGEAFDYKISNEKKQGIERIDNVFIIYADNEMKFKKVLHRWYKTKTEEAVERSLTELSPLLDSMYKSVGYRVYKRRWGSCSHDNALMFNLLLSLHSKEYIHYVVAHELAHIKEKNHSKKFYAEGERILPGFKALDKQMRKL